MYFWILCDNLRWVNKLCDKFCNWKSDLFSLKNPLSQQLSTVWFLPAPSYLFSYDWGLVEGHIVDLPHLLIATLVAEI